MLPCTVYSKRFQGRRKRSESSNEVGDRIQNRMAECALAAKNTTNTTSPNNDLTFRANNYF